MKTYLTTDLQWHDLRRDSEDIPGEDEPVLTTVEYLDGTRGTWLDAYIKYINDGEKYVWVTKAINEYDRIEETQVWYKVIAWAYPPAPFNFY